MTKLKRNTNKFTAVSFLYHIGAIWKKDFIFILKSIVNGNESQAYRLYKVLQKDKLIVEKVIEKQKGKRKSNDQYTMVMLNKDSNEYSKNDIDQYKQVCKNFRTNNASKLYRLLSDSRIKALMIKANVVYYDKYKPSLASTIEQADLEVYKQKNENFSWKKIVDERGLYYSSQEIRETISKLKQNNENASSSIGADTLMQSRIRGVIIKGELLYFVYIANPGENKLIKINSEGENKYIAAATGLFHSCFGIPFLNEQQAIIISDGLSMIYTCALGNPAGRIKDADLLEKQEVMTKNYKNRHKGKAPKYNWINSKSDIFQKIYVIPFSTEGCCSLSYLPSEINYNEKKAMVIKKLRNYDEFKSTDTVNSPSQIGTFESTRLYCMPICEIKELFKIRNQTKSWNEMPYQESKMTLSFITDFAYANAISHVIGTPCIFHSFINDELLTLDHTYEYLDYDYNGYSVGMNKIRSYINEAGYVATNKLLNSLPKKAGYDNPNIFWNEVAAGSCEFEKSIDFNELKRIEENKVKRIRKKKKTVYVKEATLDELVKRAKEKGISSNRYIADLIYKDIHSVEETPREEE